MLETSSTAVWTFYSYKGGAGRTMLLANIAALLDRWGYRVLCLDWDLEAPGLHSYFSRFADTSRTPGVVDMFLALSVDGELDWRDHVVNIKIPNSAGRLDLIPAGRLDDDYFSRLSRSILRASTRTTDSEKR
jgi:MinD-like ATPase involved in chromosome partitioning or flagellar assembly